MAIDIKNILEIVQRKIAAVGPSTSTEDLSYLLKLAKRLDGTTLVSYDSDGSLPDPATSNERLAFITSTGQVKFNNGAWDVIASEYQAPVPPPYYQGTSYGYSSGGTIPWAPAPSLNGSLLTIDKFDFASDGNAISAGTLASRAHGGAGTSSSTTGYHSGGASKYPNGTDIYETNNIRKFTFATDTSAADAGTLTVARLNTAGQSSATYGYTTGGMLGTSPLTYYLTIDKFSFTSDGNATSVGNAHAINYNYAGQQSTEYGYYSGGLSIGKFSFATDGNGTSVGALTANRYSGAGQSSATHGYQSGSNGNTTIDKWSFTSDADATSVGVLTQGREWVNGGQSSTEYGYAVGGLTPPSSTAWAIIEKFPFATDANAASVGNLTQGRGRVAGHQI